MTREELREHCLRQIEGCEMWAKVKKEEPHGRIYEEHKLILELLEQETVPRESYEHEYFLRKEFELKIDKLQRQLEKIRTEIAELDNKVCQQFLIEDVDKEVHRAYQDCLGIIDKAESEE